MTRSGSSSLYDDDFFAWTQEQAIALREASLPSASRLDIANIATEIEDWGKRDLREVETFLERLVEHLIKLARQPQARDVPHWRSEIRHFQRSARKAYSPGMRRLLDIDEIWRDGQRAANAYLADVGSDHLDAVANMFSIDELLSPDFDIDRAEAKLRA